MNLFPYQEDGVAFLRSHRHACLWDDPGLGKTPQVLVAAEREACKRILVIAPALARRNWERETRMWTPSFAPHVIEATATYPMGDFVIVSYDYARTRRDWLTATPWDLVVIDEMHMCSNQGAKRTQAILGVDGPCHVAQRVWVLSGTPLRNHAGELWPIFRVFGVTALGQEEWENRYCQVDHFQGRRVIRGTKASSLDELRALVSLTDICLRRRKREVLSQLPPVFHSDVTVEPPKRLDIMAYRSLTKYADSLPGLQSAIERGKEALQQLLDSVGKDADSLLSALAAGSSCISIVRALTGVRKIEGVSNLVRAEIAAGHYSKLVIFCHHRDVIEGIAMGLGSKAAIIWGGQDPSKRDAVIQMFQTLPEPQVLVCQMDAAGVALNMTAASNCLIVEPPYVPAVARQCIDRLHRIGQANSISCRWVALPDDEFDRTVIGILRRKSASINAILDGGSK